ncbi:MAG: Uma2 family endonuclease [Thermoanaerobaculia bacterium]
MSDSRPIAYEARSSDRAAPSGAAGASPWGSRWVEEAGAGGSVRWRERPLTWKDLLDPQEGDVMVHGTLHGQIIRTTAVMLQTWFEARGRNDVLITDDVKMLWGIPGLADIGPDIAVIPDVSDPSRRRDSFRVVEEGTRPSLVIEVISKSTKKFDEETKPGIYEQAGVRECFLLDPLREPWVLSGQRRSEPGGAYRAMEHDAGGRLVSEATGLRFGVGEGGANLVIEHSVTGERLRSPSEEAVARRAAELEAARQQAAREEAERRAARAVAEKEALEAKLARLERTLESQSGRKD